MTRPLTLAAIPPALPATRRNLFGAASAMLLLSAAEAGPAKAAELDGELLALCSQAVALHEENVAASDALDAAGLAYSSPEGHAARSVIHARSDAWHDLCDRITALPAKTPEGMRGKAVVLRRVVALEEPLVASLCRDILGRAGA